VSKSAVIDPKLLKAILYNADARRAHALAADDLVELTREGLRWLGVGAREYAATSIAKTGRARMKRGRAAWDRLAQAISDMEGLPLGAKTQLLATACEVMEGGFWAGSAMTALLQDTEKQKHTKRVRKFEAKKKIEALDNKVAVGEALFALWREDLERWGLANAKDIATHLAAGDLVMDERTIAKHLNALGVPPAPSGKPGRPRSTKPKSRNTSRAV
jgi:hypothetical protein